MNSRRTGEARAALGNRLRDNGSFRYAQPRTAIGFRHRHTEPAACCDVSNEIIRETAVTVAPQPIGVIIFGTGFGYRIADGLLVLAEAEIHSLPSCYCYGSLFRSL